MKNLALRLSSFCCLLVFASSAWAVSLNAIHLNQKAGRLLKEQKYLDSQEFFFQALKEEPMWSTLHLNLGLTYEGLGQVEKAKESYLTAQKLAQAPEELFAANFNLGELAGKQKEVDSALTYYQAALDIKPDSHEAKVNIELLISQGQSGGKGDKDQDKDKKDQDKNQDQQKDKDKQDENKKKEYQPQKPQPRKFKSEDLSQADVNKILGEIKQQEQKIRQEYNRKEIKEAPRGKDW